MPSCRSAYLVKHRDNFTFFTYITEAVSKNLTKLYEV
jgi:hypothetical protein